MGQEVELNVSDLAAPGQWETIFSAFERLAARQTLELRLSVPGAASGLLARFQERYGQGFDWWPLHHKPDSLTMLIARRAREPRTISGFLGADHLRLAEYWEEFLDAVRTCELSYETLFTSEGGYRVAAVERLAQFIFGLRRHIRMEEEHLFPRFEERSRVLAGSGPTAVMRTEHQQIEQILKAMEKELLAGVCATLIQTIGNQSVHPSVLFRNHDMKEESVLYPLADRLFTQEERDDLCLKMQAV